MTRVRFLLASYVAILVALFLYSLTQIDLSLTFSRLSAWQVIEKSFQQLGFFNRPLSTAIFIIILVLLFIHYFAFIFLANKQKITTKQLWFLVLAGFVILVFSYNAFSYDLFNYIFDAKILTFYHQNPYLHKALDFPNDPMLSFMRWTHRLYPYGPSWLILTLPLSFIGLGFFLPTFLLFKLLMGFSFLGSCYLIYKISEKIFPENKLVNLAFFALNPLVLIESLVSAHNDIAMIFFLLLSIYCFILRKNAYSLISYLFSAGVKYSTGVFLPIFMFAYYKKRKNKNINWEQFFLVAFLLAITTVFVATIRTTFQPWYLLLPLSMASFISKKYYVFVPVILSSIFATSLYIPYVFMTDYAKEYPSIILTIETFGLFATVLLTFLYFSKIKFFRKH
jgi:hypothetical protein